MKLFTSLDSLPHEFRAAAVAIGNFDGVHHGHAQIIAQLNRRAAEFSGPSVVFTFEPHPVRLLRPESAPSPLTWVDRKAYLLSQLNVDVVIAYPTDQALLDLSPDDYFDKILKRRLKARAIVEGPNFYFGRNREGNIQKLSELCAAESVSLDIVEPVKLGGEFVSSSRVRSALAGGDVDEANRMLTKPYRIRGMVTHGAGRGQSIGVPTANVSAVDTLLPGEGVYAGVGHTADGAWPAAINIGPNPTFDEDRSKVEVHLVGYAGSLYGDPLEVDFLTRLRDIQQFSSVEQLQSQLQLDIERARRIFEE